MLEFRSKGVTIIMKMLFVVTATDKRYTEDVVRRYSYRQYADKTRL